MEYGRRILSVLLIPLLLLWIISHHTAESLDLVVFPDEAKTIPAGSNLVLNCMALGPGPNGNPPKLVWITPEGKEIDSSFGRISVNSGYYTSHLYIKDAREADVGKFTCRAIGRHQKILKEKDFILNIYRSITYVDCPAYQQLQEYRSGLIKCIADSTPALVISWKLRGRYIYNGPIYAQERNGLRILNVTAEDAGMYTCVSEITHMGIFRSKVITVRVKGAEAGSDEARR